jgi:lysophospholipase L1-like esterase
MGFPIVAGDRVHVVGDSITQFGWATAAGSFFAQVNATWATPALAPIYASSSGGKVVASGGAVVIANSQPQGKAITATTSGVSGNKVADIQSAVASRIVAFNPTKLIIEVGINDFLASTDPTAFGISYDSIVTQTLSALPSCQIMCLSLLTFNEQWAAGPAWPGVAIDSAYDPAIQTVCTNRGCTYVDLRTPLLAYEVAHNTPGPPGVATGIVTSDGIHPIVTSGQVLMGTWVFANVTVTP